MSIRILWVYGKACRQTPEAAQHVGDDSVHVGATHLAETPEPGLELTHAKQELGAQAVMWQRVPRMDQVCPECGPGQLRVQSQLPQCEDTVARRTLQGTLDRPRAQPIGGVSPRRSGAHAHG